MGKGLFLLDLEIRQWWGINRVFPDPSGNFFFRVLEPKLLVIFISRSTLVLFEERMNFGGWTKADRRVSTQEPKLHSTMRFLLRAHCSFCQLFFPIPFPFHFFTYSCVLYTFIRTCSYKCSYTWYLHMLLFLYVFVRVCLCACTGDIQHPLTKSWRCISSLFYSQKKNKTAFIFFVLVWFLLFVRIWFGVLDQHI